MQITLGNKVGTAKAGTLKNYRANCANLNAAASYAYTMAKKLNERMIVIEGNSYMNKVFFICKESDSVSKYTAMKVEVNVVVVQPDGEVFYGVAK
jgi:hypothetical protein